MGYNKINHRFKSTWTGKKKEKPNRIRQFPTLSFRTNELDPDVLNYLLKLKDNNSMSRFICSSIQTRHFIEFNSGFFLLNIVEQYYDKVKKLLRRVGRERTKIKAKENNQNIYKD